MTRPPDLRYRLFGLVIASHWPLPELAPADADAPVDLTITIGDLPSLPDGPGPHAVAGGIALRLTEAGDYWIFKGREVRIAPLSGIADEQVRLYLLGSVMGVVLHQRQWLPLHANAVLIDGRAMLFMGEAGAGKSTLAATFAGRGHQLLADDVSVVRFDAGAPQVVAGLGRLRLWGDALRRSGRAPDNYRRSWPGDPDYAKYDVPLAASAEPAPLAAIYVLERGAALDFSRLEGAAAVAALAANTYRGGMVGSIGDPAAHFRQCVALAGAVPLFRVERRWAVAAIEDDARGMIDHARQAGRG